MTAAGQSALNVRGLDTVIIDDTRFTNLIERGRNVLTRLHLGANEILQMAGRVHGRVEGGRVYLLSDRDIQFEALRPTPPEFQLAGDSERVAMTCAALGVRADELELPVPLDRRAYREAVRRLEERGIVENGRLTRYGRLVEEMPVERPWAELLVHADDDLVPYVAVMSAIESLHRMTRDERDLEGLIVPGSDHLTAYNLYADAYRRAGYVGEVYGLPRHLFHEEEIERWAEERGALVKAVEDAALGMASVYRALDLPLPARMPMAGDRAHRAFADLLARYMPLELVIDEEGRDGQEVRVSKGSVCGSWGAIAGEIRYFADRSGVPRAAIEGTQIPYDLVRRHAVRGEPRLAYDPAQKRHPLALRRAVTYFGFELEREIEPIEAFPPALVQPARHLLAEALARGEARHRAVQQNREAIEELRELWRRSGGRTPRLGVPELTTMYEALLTDQEVRSLEEFRAADLRLGLDGLVPDEDREALAALPDAVEVRGREVAIRYDVEDGVGGVARLVLPEKLARTLTEPELPALDRPVRFVVPRGQRGSVRAPTLDDLQERLDQPWSEEEMRREREERDRRRERAHERHRERRMREAARELRHARERDRDRGAERARDDGAGDRRDARGARGRGGRRGHPGAGRRGPGGRGRGRGR
jgi:hypothetical protein